MRTLLSLILLLSLVSCTQGQKSEASFVLSLGALATDLTFASTAIRLVNPKTGQVINEELTPPYKMTIPYGTWNLYLVGSEGSNWQGPYLCGSLSNVGFSTSEATITFFVSSANCVNEPFSSIISAKNPNPSQPTGEWDVSLFNQAKWGPQ